ncbi:MAG: hypothetical protein ACRDNS_29405 [Trebonia sp.]
MVKVTENLLLTTVSSVDNCRVTITIGELGFVPKTLMAAYAGSGLPIGPVTLPMAVMRDWPAG